MDYLLNSPFILDFIATTSLFAICLFLVVGAKVVLSSIKSFLKRPEPVTRNAPEPTPKPTEKLKAPRRYTKKPIRSIEINPEEVDRIYVKKISKV